jgi:hypothetical protein
MIRASPAGRPIRPARVQTRLCGQENRENAPQRADTTGQKSSGRPIPGPNVGERWVSPDSHGRPRVPPHVLPWPTRQRDNRKLKCLRRFAPRASSIDAILRVVVLAGDQCRCLSDHAGRQAPWPCLQIGREASRHPHRQQHRQEQWPKENGRSGARAATMTRRWGPAAGVHHRCPTTGLLHDATARPCHGQHQRLQLRRVRYRRAKHLRVRAIECMCPCA